MERSLVIAVTISMAFHVLLLGVKLLRLHGQALLKDQRTLEVIYEYRLAERDARALQRSLTSLRDQTSAAPTPSALAMATTQIRIPERSTTALPVTPELQTSRTAVVDLTNLVEAAQGDPVLLSYFSAIREEIQKTANQRAWLAAEAAEGLVYVSFVLSSSGQVQAVAILRDRSASSSSLHDIALKIIKASSPFPPFPPSLAVESSKTVVVPLEFLVGS